MLSLLACDSECGGDQEQKQRGMWRVAEPQRDCSGVV